MTSEATTNGKAARGEPGPRWNTLYYDDWVAREGLDLIRGYKADNLHTVPLKFWARTGGYGVHIQLGAPRLD